MVCERACQHRGAAPVLSSAASARPDSVEGGGHMRGGSRCVRRPARPPRGARLEWAAPITPSPSLTGHPRRRGPEGSRRLGWPGR